MSDDLLTWIIDYTEAVFPRSIAYVSYTSCDGFIIDCRVVRFSQIPWC